MPRQLSANAFRAMFAQETAEVFLMCLTIEHASLAQPIRVVYNNEPITRTSGIFQPAAFEVSLPEENAEQVPTVTLSFDNVDRAISDAIRSVVGRPKVTMEVILASSPDTVEAGPFIFSLMDSQYDVSKVDSTLGLEDDILNTVFPKDKFTPTNSPGLFS